MLLAYALKSTLILAAAALLVWMLRRRSAATRHLVWTAAAAALLALPLLAWLMPQVRVPVRNSGPMAIFQVFVTATPLASGARTPAAARGLAAGVASRLPDSTLPWIEILWAAGVAFSLAQMLWAWMTLVRLRRRARPFREAADTEVLARSLGIEHRVELLESPRGTMPMTCGILRPAVLMPAGSAEWTRERLRIVLLHELAHVRRGDLATHLMARMALSLNWWNPLAWYAWRAFVRERERATDDLVLAAGERASDYAGHLLEIARSFQPEPATAAAALAMARRSQLEGRLVAILDTGINRRPAGRRAALVAVLVALAIAAPFAAVQAQDVQQPPNPNFRVVATSENPPEVDATIRAAVSQRNYAILDRAAAAYELHGNHKIAQRLLEQGLAIRGEVHGVGSPEYAAGLVKLGAAAEAADPAEAEADYAKAVSFGDRPEVASALLYLGRRALTAHQNPAQAEQYFQRTLAVDQTGLPALLAHFWLASVLKDQGRMAEAEDQYQKAIAVPHPGYDLANALDGYGVFLDRQNRDAESAQMRARAAEIRRAETKSSSAAVAVPAGVYHVGNGVTAPQLIYKVEPQYTETARAAKYQGTVLLFLVVQPDGTATDFKVVRSLGLGLDEKAIEAVRQWRFRPGAKDGAPVPVAATIEVNFRLL
jgi:TonB family protein